MAHRGPDPKAAKHGRYQNTGEWTEVADEPYDGPSPDLPKLPNRRKWNELVVQWWEDVRRMPHVVMWRPTDWNFALRTAMAMNDYYSRAVDERTTSESTEIRRREALMGTTRETLRQLRIRYVQVAEFDTVRADGPVVVVEQQTTVDGAGVAAGGTVTSLAERRRALTKPA